MTDEEKAYYEEWKRKCAAGRARKKKEIEEWKRREEKPGFKLITRGPRKGQLVPKNYLELRDERRARSWQRYTESRKARELKELSSSPPPSEKPPTISKEPQPKKHFSPEVLLAFLIVTSFSLASFFVAKALATFGILGICCLVDAVAYFLFAKKRRRSKYLPFLWWLGN